jgi:hypothetical protein
MQAPWELGHLSASYKGHGYVASNPWTRVWVEPRDSGCSNFRACIRDHLISVFVDTPLAPEFEHHAALTVVLLNLCSWHSGIIPMDGNRKPS